MPTVARKPGSDSAVGACRAGVPFCTARLPAGHSLEDHARSIVEVPGVPQKTSPNKLGHLMSSGFTPKKYIKIS
jgi:hypothetical protein